MGTGEGFRQAEGMMHDETPCVGMTRLVRAPPAEVERAGGWSVGQLHGSLLTCLLVTVAVRRGECNLVVLVQLPYCLFSCGDQAAIHDERHNLGDFGGQVAVRARTCHGFPQARHDCPGARRGDYEIGRASCRERV